MSKQNQCEMCQRRCYSCGHYDESNDDYCQHFVKPIDNTKMFSHWYTTTGRIGRMEYILSLLLALVAFGLMLGLVTFYMASNDITIETSWEERIFTWIVFGPSVAFLIFAGTKRAHDAGSPEWLAYAPVAYLVWPHLFLLIFGILGTLYLIKDPSEPGINEYGTSPSMAYDQQINEHYIE